MRGSVGALPRPAIYAIKKPKGLGGEYQFAGAAADYAFGSAFAVDRCGGAAQLLSLFAINDYTKLDSHGVYSVRSKHQNYETLLQSLDNWPSYACSSAHLTRLHNHWVAPVERI